MDTLTSQQVAEEIQQAKQNICDNFGITTIENPLPLLAIGLTLTGWRNTVVEHAHCLGRLHDGEMFAANVINTRFILDRIQNYPDVDWKLLANEFIDADRLIGRRAIVDILGKTRHKKWVSQARKVIEVVPYFIQDVGAELTLWWLANGSQPFYPSSCPDWWGSPRWTEFVEKFTQSLTVQPPGMNRTELCQTLLYRPEDIDPQILQWCVRDQGMKFFFYENLQPWSLPMRGVITTND